MELFTIKDIAIALTTFFSACITVHRIITDSYKRDFQHLDNRLIRDSQQFDHRLTRLEERMDKFLEKNRR